MSQNQIGKSSHFQVKTEAIFFIATLHLSTYYSPPPVGEGQDVRERRLGAETRCRGLSPAALPALRVAAARAAVTARILTHLETRRTERKNLL